jgi:predicted AAA+ superfamily ATPase
MRRIVEERLETWRSSRRRKPLLIRGARQVGKTWSVKQFGRERFENVVTVDLERNPELHRVFQADLDPHRVVSELEVLTRSRIIEGRTLLFLDEIQACPRALASLRYFHEEMGGLHVAAAGSLLEFALKDLSFPVGRLQFIEMLPMTFVEFLWAVGEQRAAELVRRPPGTLGEAVHGKLLELVRRYLLVGGMPECVEAYAASGALREAFEAQREIVESYRSDFAKYAARADKDVLRTVLDRVAQGVGRKVKYSRLYDAASHPTVKRAFDLLCLARLIRRVPAASPAGLPLSASASARVFKAFMVDVGLMNALGGLSVEHGLTRPDLLDVYRGALAEQFVAQELVAAQGGELYYWAREARGSSAEVDFLAAVDGRVVPIEVKSGPAGRMKSLQLLLATYPEVRQAYVVSTSPYERVQGSRVTRLPLYYVFSHCSA